MTDKDNNKKPIKRDRAPVNPARAASPITPGLSQASSSARSVAAPKIKIPSPQISAASTPSVTPDPGSSLPPDFSSAVSIFDIRRILEVHLLSSASKIPKASIDYVLSSFSRVEQLYLAAQTRISHLEGRLEERAAVAASAPSDAPTPRTFASVAASSPSSPKFPVHVPPKKHSVIVNSSVSEDSEEVRSDVSSALRRDPKIRVTNIRKLRGGSVVIEAASGSDLDSIKTAFASSDHLSCSDPKKILPRLKVFDVPKFMTNERFIDDLLVKNVENESLRNEVRPRIKVVTRLKSRFPDKEHFVVSVPGSVRNTFIGKGRVFVDLGSHHLVDHFNITRCFNCQQFGHSSGSCTKPKVCGFCAKAGHAFKDCPSKSSTPCCANCRAGSLSTTDHDTASRDCPSYAKQLARYKGLIDYSQ